MSVRDLFISLRVEPVKTCNASNDMSDFLLFSISPDPSFAPQPFVHGLLANSFRLCDIGEAGGTARLKARGRSAPSAVD